MALLVPQEQLERYGEALHRYLKTGEARLLGGRPVEMEALASGGARIPVELTLSAPTIHEEGLIVAAFRDLRHRRRLGLYEALLPVCCMCGQIRDDTDRDVGQGDWGSLEDYVAQRAAARFSHTFCPACLDRDRREQGIAARASVSSS